MGKEIFCIVIDRDRTYEIYNDGTYRGRHWHQDFSYWKVDGDNVYIRHPGDNDGWLLLQKPASKGFAQSILEAFIEKSLLGQVGV